MERSEAEFTIEEMESLLEEWRSQVQFDPWISKYASDLHFAIKDLEQAIKERAQ